MDITSIVGLVAAFGLMVFGIMEGGNISDFMHLSSAIITFGGTIAVLVSSTPMHILADIPKHMGIIFGNKKNNAMKYIDTIVEFAQIARKSGLLALEEKANAEDDPFLKNSVLLVVDGIDADKVKSMMEANLDNIYARHEEAIGFYEKGAAFGPAFGMIGTLIGLINMLKGLDVSSDEGAATLGEGMSTALITTFYGSLIANVIFMPWANKMRAKNDEEMLCKSIIMEGVLSIQAGENPKYIREKLESLLSRKELKAAEKKSGKAPAAPAEE